MFRMRTGLTLLVAVIVAVVGVKGLSRATMSTHQSVPRDSQIELILDAKTKNGSPGQTLTEMVTAQVLTCRLEVSSDLLGAVHPAVESGSRTRYRVVLTPSMDHTDRRQFRGCLQDWAIDHVQLHVVRLAPL